MKMFDRFWFCLCLWHLVGVFGDEMKFVKLGDSVTLNSGLTELMDNDQIQWRFWIGNTSIAEINVTADSMTVYDDVLDGRFRDRLKLDKQTGSLTITNITTEHNGVYLGVVINRTSIPFFLAVYDEISVKKGDSVTINSGLTEIMDNEEIQWAYMKENALITVINKQADSMTVFDDVLDGRFRDRLKLNNQTGSLTITNITPEHTGRYVLLILGPKESLKAFSVSVYSEIICFILHIFLIYY
uniref:Immunoglobulin domain-containing protein n=1 Tax=Cyprinus carpio TaxID=7962 RepID=A0A8C1LCT1_CYPCA